MQRILLARTLLAPEKGAPRTPQAAS
jgi:hypothetical protein